MKFLKKIFFKFFDNGIVPVVKEKTAEVPQFFLKESLARYEEYLDKEEKKSRDTLASLDKKIVATKVAVNEIKKRISHLGDSISKKALKSLFLIEISKLERISFDLKRSKEKIKKRDYFLTAIKAVRKYETEAIFASKNTISSTVEEVSLKGFNEKFNEKRERRVVFFQEKLFLLEIFSFPSFVGTGKFEEVVAGGGHKMWKEKREIQQQVGFLPPEVKFIYQGVDKLNKEELERVSSASL